MNRSAFMPYLWMVNGCIAFTFMGNFTFALGHVSAIGISLDWQIIAFFRAFLVFLFSIILALAFRINPVVIGSRSLWLRSIAGSGSLVCSFYALTKLQLSLVLTVTNMFPLWVALLSWPMLKKRPSLSEWLAVCMGIIGVGLVQKPHFSDNYLAIVSAITASFFTALAMIGLHKIKGISTQAIVVHFSGVATGLSLLVLPFAPNVGTTICEMDFKMVLLLLGVGISATIGQNFLTLAFSSGAPTKVSVVGLSQVVFAVIGDVLFWHKSLDSIELIGILLILLPTGWVMIKSDPGLN
ncbi:MAG: DMT family transporter [Planctomycetes bacterium]|nr:DMT family transporter [Planctomycetota bacterium]